MSIPIFLMEPKKWVGEGVGVCMIIKSNLNPLLIDACDIESVNC